MISIIEVVKRASRTIYECVIKPANEMIQGAKNVPKRFKAYDLTNQTSDYFNEQKDAFEWVRGRAYKFKAKDLFIHDYSNQTIIEFRLA